MNWIVAVVEVVKALAWPVAFLVMLYWFKCEVRQFLKEVGNFIGKRTFRAAYAGASLEIGSVSPESLNADVQEQLRKIQRAIPPSVSPAESAKIADVVEARQFILRDEAGLVRAELGLFPDGETHVPAFRLFDSKGISALTLIVDNQGRPGIMAFRPKSGMFLVSISQETGPLLSLESSAENSTLISPDILSISNGRIRLAATKNGTSSIAMRNLDGRRIFIMPDQSSDRDPFPAAMR